ncbi:hypothetical protein CRYUN_Cryun40dG0059700 [Craigia yunnanensis]
MGCSMISSMALLPYAIKEKNSSPDMLQPKINLIRTDKLPYLCLSEHQHHNLLMADYHPGGDEVLLSATGKDATDDFEDVGHSGGASDMMDQYIVGEIDVLTIPKNTKYKPPK